MFFLVLFFVLFCLQCVYPKLGPGWCMWGQRGLSDQRPGLILPLQQNNKDYLGSEWVTAPAPPAQFCVKLLLKVFKDFHPPSSHSPSKWQTFEFLSQGGKLLKWKKNDFPLFWKGERRKVGLLLLYYSLPMKDIISNVVKNWLSEIKRKGSLFHLPFVCLFCLTIQCPKIQCTF